LELRIADEDFNPLSFNTQGKIQLRGHIIMQRYFNNPKATEESMTPDGWFDTGDVGYQDDNGNLIISGRSKEILILNG
jgi:long-subunit acyl-CoA synthetase (AMP-forming)